MDYFFFFLRMQRPPRSTRTYTPFPYTTLFRSQELEYEPGIVKNFALDSTIIGGALQEEPRRRIIEDDLACAAEQREVVHRLEDDAAAALIFSGTAVALCEGSSQLLQMLTIAFRHELRCLIGRV